MKNKVQEHAALAASLRQAYSAERAAALAYVGHAAALSDTNERAAIQLIEQDEWEHRREVYNLLRQYEIPASTFQETKYLLIGKVIGFSCLFLGRFMPYFFAGKLESGNVCAYFVMIRHFHELGITKHDTVLYEMGIKEKEHEVHFQQVIKDAIWLPFFERIFGWGMKKSLNDVDLDTAHSVNRADQYCKGFKHEGGNYGENK